MSDFFWFSDVQWSRLEPLLPTDVRGRKRVDDRRVLTLGRELRLSAGPSCSFVHAQHDHGRL